MSIVACVLDSREPSWVRNLSFGGIPTTVMALEAGDLQAVTDDGHIILVERKEPNDFLGTLRSERLYPQIAGLVQERVDQQITGQQVTTWPYLLVSGEFRCSPDGHVITDDRGPTGWDWSAVQGALLGVQEMGCMVVFCNGDRDYEAAIIRLCNRKRDAIINLLPPRVPNVLGAGATFLAGLPGIGVERVMELLKQAGNIPAHALVGITDLEIQVPGIPMATRKKIRQMLGLRDKQSLELWINEIGGDEVLKVTEKVS